jgi:hypothetical protein
MLHIELMQTIQADRERAFRGARQRYEARLATGIERADRPSGADGRVPVDDRPSHQRNLSPDLGRR